MNMKQLSDDTINKPEDPLTTQEIEKNKPENALTHRYQENLQEKMNHRKFIQKLMITQKIIHRKTIQKKINHSKFIQKLMIYLPENNTQENCLEEDKAQESFDNNYFEDNYSPENVLQEVVLGNDRSNFEKQEGYEVEYLKGEKDDKTKETV